MNALAKPGDYPLNLLKGRTFVRLSPSLVETFIPSSCPCGNPIALSCLKLSESDDQRLIREGLLPADDIPPEGIIRFSHADPCCPDCHKAWLNPYLNKSDSLLHDALSQEENGNE